MYHLGLKALPDIRRAGLGRRLRYTPFFQLLQDITPLMKEAVKKKVRALLESITKANVDDTTANDETCRRAAESAFPLVIREVGLKITDQVMFGYTKVFMKDAAHDTLMALGIRGRFMEELSLALQDVGTCIGTGSQIFRLRAAVRAAIGVGLHQPELHIRQMRFSNVHGSETLSAAKEVVTKHLPLFATRVQAFTRGALFRCARGRKYNGVTKKLSDMMATATSALLQLEHEQYRDPLKQLIQACAGLPFASSSHFEYVGTLRMAVSKAAQLIQTMDTYSTAKKQLTDLLDINPMSNSSTDIIDPKELIEFSERIQIQIGSLASKDVRAAAPIVVEAQRRRKHLAEVLAHIKVLEDATVTDPLSGKSGVQTKDILAAATLLGEHLAKAEALGMNARFPVLKPTRAALTQGKARVAHLIMLDEMTSALTPSDNKPMTSDVLAALAEPVLEALFGAGELAGMAVDVFD